MTFVVLFLFFFSFHIAVPFFLISENIFAQKEKTKDKIRAAGIAVGDCHLFVWFFGGGVCEQIHQHFVVVLTGKLNL